MQSARTEIAYAKINLALHVRARRGDGYHELETLFAFCDFGDALTISAADRFAFSVDGEFGAGLGTDADNLVVRAARAIRGDEVDPAFHIHLQKNLPVAAGLGGGSADAAAIFRMMGAADRYDLAASLGADVPACIASVPCIGRGTGTDLAAVENDVARLNVLLINPCIPLSTGPVFKAWDGIDRGDMPGGTARQILLAGRNDLERPAISLCPAIADVLAALQATGPIIARMSGSGATCFALYEAQADVEAAKAEISVRQPGWWLVSGRLR
jgi:4-diphosphocytidyl-2-C-methyl-D-erythritol kinase